MDLNIGQTTQGAIRNLSSRTKTLLTTAGLAVLTACGGGGGGGGGNIPNQPPVISTIPKNGLIAGGLSVGSELTTLSCTDPEGGAVDFSVIAKAGFEVTKNPDGTYTITTKSPLFTPGNIDLAYASCSEAGQNSLKTTQEITANIGANPNATFLQGGNPGSLSNISLSSLGIETYTSATAKIGSTVIPVTYANGVLSYPIPANSSVGLMVTRVVGKTNSGASIEKVVAQMIDPFPVNMSASSGYNFPKMILNSDGLSTTYTMLYHTDIISMKVDGDLPAGVTINTDFSGNAGKLSITIDPKKFDATKNGGNIFGIPPLLQLKINNAYFYPEIGTDTNTPPSLPLEWSGTKVFNGGTNDQFNSSYIVDLSSLFDKLPAGITITSAVATIGNSQNIRATVDPSGKKVHIELIGPASGNARMEVGFSNGQMVRGEVRKMYHQ